MKPRMDRFRRDRNQQRHRAPLRQRAVIAIPSGFTFANLFFGIFAIVTASRGDFFTAGLYVVLGGVCDMLDGRVARATNSGTRFGAELDSLVDVVTFGVAPAMIMYFAVLNRQGWDWIWAFVYVACAAWRLAVFNVEQAGRAKQYFHGLPSPAAGLTLATYYWFSQTTWYTDTNIVNLPWHQMLRFVMFGLAALMISRVPYPAFPVVGIKNTRQILGLLVVIATIAGVFFIPKQFFFPACMLYVGYGLVKTVLLGLFNRRAADDSTPTHRHVHNEFAEPFEPAVAISSGPRLSVSADTLTSDDDETSSSSPRRRRRRRPRGPRPDGDRSDESRSESSSPEARENSHESDRPRGNREGRSSGRRRGRDRSNNNPNPSSSSDSVSSTPPDSPSGE